MANVTPLTRDPNLSMWQPHRPERPEKSEGGKRFRLVSEFEPKGDQPKAIEELCSGLNSIERDQVLLGVTGSGKTFTMAKIIEQTQRPALIMAPNKTLAAQLYAEFKSFFPDNAVEYFVSYYDYYQPEAYVPRTDTFIEKDSSVNEQIDRMRHAATRAILERDDVIIVASVSCIYGIGSVETYTAMTVDLAKGQEMDPRRLMAQLVELQYQRNDLAFQRGVFRVRGDTIELFPAHYDDMAWRFDFFGDEIDTITEFDPLTGKTIRNIDQVRVYANSHYVTPRPTVQSAMKGIKKELNETLKIFEAEGKLLEAQRRRVIDLGVHRDAVELMNADIKTQEEALDQLSDKSLERDLISGNDQTNASLLTPATEPGEPDSPKLVLNSVVGGILGALLGCIIALSRESSRPQIRSIDDLMDGFDLPVLVSLPDSASTKRHRGGGGGGGRALPQLSHLGPSNAPRLEN